MSRPSSAYFKFYSEIRPTINNGNIKEIIDIITTKWINLPESEKNKYR
jgi:hypothetical protein